jgi:glycosyltransferase involved in cell wall biosynthesis
MPAKGDDRVPDVTVIVAVYNTMPYLTECLESVFEQTIGTARLEVITVDDGSTDGSGEELARWAELYPDTMTVVRQPNSGGPAQPSNRALELATGRYVFFLGADDRLGLEALERLVTAADDLDADIVLGRLVGVGGRRVNQGIYRHGDHDDVTLADSALAWALSNTKLFRRSMLEQHGIRYREDMASCSDQPFTMRAIAAARRIAVRSGYEFYYAIRRDDASNITFRTSPSRFLHDTAIVMDAAADLITDPEARYRVLRRHFTWEVGKLLDKRFLAADRAEQQVVQEGIRKLADTYLTEEVRASLDVQHRVSISVAQRGTLDDTVAVSRHYAEHALSKAVGENGRLYVAYPGFRTPGKDFPDEWFEATKQIFAADHQTEPARVSWGQAPDGRPALLATWRTAAPTTGVAEDRSQVKVQRGPAASDVTTDAEGVVSATFPLDGLVAGERKRRLRTLSVTRTMRGWTVGYDVKAAGLTDAGRRLHRSGARLFLVSVGRDREHHLGVRVLPLTPRTVAQRLSRKIRLGR